MLSGSEAVGTVNPTHPQMKGALSTWECWGTLRTCGLSMS